MPKRSSIPKDLNETAYAVVAQVTTEIQPKPPAKNPAAVALGRLGGLKGGKARAESLSKKRRAQIATQAALIRWKDSKSRH